ncbi:hypothetical protein QCA50_013859 [Cerrena zonata]|uniref:Uncharacterized protein n=1 Tax=Cerrena zonata TaxID=2478898 RepID=A0AAW0FQP3_9APHY
MLTLLSILVVTGGICIPAITGLAFAWLPDVCAVPGIVYLGLSISAHVILTSLIVVRLALLRRKLLKTFGDDHGKPYFSLAVVLVESASLYTIWALTSLILYGKDSPGQFVFLPAQGQIQAVCTLLIIDWVASGRALSGETDLEGKSKLESVYFSSCVPPQPPESTYFSPTSSTSKLPIWRVDTSSHISIDKKIPMLSMYE